jgi:hypothetical protein
MKRKRKKKQAIKKRRKTKVKRVLPLIDVIE